MVYLPNPYRRLCATWHRRRGALQRHARLRQHRGDYQHQPATRRNYKTHVCSRSRSTMFTKWLATKPSAWPPCPPYCQCAKTRSALLPASACDTPPYCTTRECTPPSTWPPKKAPQSAPPATEWWKWRAKTTRNTVDTAWFALSTTATGSKPSTHT